MSVLEGKSPSPIDESKPWKGTEVLSCADRGLPGLCGRFLSDETPKTAMVVGPKRNDVSGISEVCPPMTAEPEGVDEARTGPLLRESTMESEAAIDALV